MDFRDTVHSSAIDSLAPVSRKHQVFDENDKKSRDSLKRNTKNHKAYLSDNQLSQYLVRLPIQTYVKKFRLGSETCKTPG